MWLGGLRDGIAANGLGFCTESSAEKGSVRQMVREPMREIIPRWLKTLSGARGRWPTSMRLRLLVLDRGS